jgi:hypothetical protein
MLATSHDAEGHVGARRGKDQPNQAVGGVDRSDVLAQAVYAGKRARGAFQHAVPGSRSAAQSRGREGDGRRDPVGASRRAFSWNRVSPSGGSDGARTSSSPRCDARAGRRIRWSTARAAA